MDELRQQPEDERTEQTGEVADAELEQAAGGLILGNVVTGLTGVNRILNNSIFSNGDLK